MRRLLQSTPDHIDLVWAGETSTCSKHGIRGSAILKESSHYFPFLARHVGTAVSIRFLDLLCILEKAVLQMLLCRRNDELMDLPLVPGLGVYYGHGRPHA